MARAIILVLDSFGIGATADAEDFGDVGSDTFGNIARVRAESGRPLPPIDGWDVSREKRYGRTTVTFLERSPVG